MEIYPTQKSNGGGLPAHSPSSPNKAPLFNNDTLEDQSSCSCCTSIFNCIGSFLYSLTWPIRFVFGWFKYFICCCQTDTSAKITADQTISLQIIVDDPVGQAAAFAKDPSAHFKALWKGLINTPDLKLLSLHKKELVSFMNSLKNTLHNKAFFVGEIKFAKLLFVTFDPNKIKSHGNGVRSEASRIQQFFFTELKKTIDTVCGKKTVEKIPDLKNSQETYGLSFEKKVTIHQRTIRAEFCQRFSTAICELLDANKSSIPPLPVDYKVQVKTHVTKKVFPKHIDNLYEVFGGHIPFLASKLEIIKTLDPTDKDYISKCEMILETFHELTTQTVRDVFQKK